MSYSIRDLRAKTDDELITEHDEKAKHTVVGVDYYLRELDRRETERLETKLYRLTVASTALAAVAVIISVIALLQTT